MASQFKLEPESEGEPKQGRLLKYENPLEKKLGREFFRQIPKTAGVYYFRGDQDMLLYVGKAKNLQARLLSYYRAKPENVSRKVIRMLHLAEKIHWELCENEEAALLRENFLLRELKPPFNRLNTNPEYYSFITLLESKSGSESTRVHRTYGVHEGAYEKPHSLRFRITSDEDTFEEGERVFGAFKGYGFLKRAYSALLRLFWVMHAKNERFAYPGQLVRYRPASPYWIHFPASATTAQWVSWTSSFLRGTSRRLLSELSQRILENAEIPPFIYHCIQEDLELLNEFFDYAPKRNKQLRKHHHHLGEVIPQDQLDDYLVLYRLRGMAR